jgi:DNA-binding PadR family transcriptional regulator
MGDRDIRITGPLLKVLQEFLSQPTEQLSGADIAQRSKLASGTLYPLLKRLEDAEWLTSKWEDVSPREVGRPRRRLYKITAIGNRRARAAFHEIQAPMGVPAWSM